MYLTFLTPELCLFFTAFCYVLLFLFKSITNIYSKELWISFLITLLFTFGLLFFIIVTNFSQSLTIIFNSYLFISKGTLEFKIIFIVFNFLYFMSFSQYSIKTQYLELFFFNLLFYLFSSFILLSSNNLFLIFLCIELQNFITYILISTSKTKQTTLKSVFLYLILNSLLAICFLFSLIILYTFFKTLTITDLKLIFSVISIAKISNWLIISFFLLIGTILFKLSSAPFHFWLKDIYSGVPISLIGFFNINTKLLYFFLLIQCLFLFNNIYFETYFTTLFIICGGLSLIIGSLLTLYQRTIKTFLICSSITHIGYLLLLLINYKNLFNLTVLYSYLLIYIFTLIILWGILSYLTEYSVQTDFFFTELSITFKYTPLLSLIFCFSLLSLAGIPPFLGFFLKYQLLLIIFTSTNLSFLLFTLIISVIASYYYLLLLKLIFFDPQQKFTLKLSYNLIKTESTFSTLTILFSFLILSPLFYFLIYQLSYTLISLQYI